MISPGNCKLEEKIWTYSPQKDYVCLHSQKNKKRYMGHFTCTYVLLKANTSIWSRKSKYCELYSLWIPPPPTYRSKVKNVQNILSHGDTPIGQNLVCLYQKAKKILPDSNSWWKYNFHIDVKGQGHTEVMNACDTSYHGDTLTCQT